MWEDAEQIELSQLRLDRQRALRSNELLFLSCVREEEEEEPTVHNMMIPLVYMQIHGLKEISWFLVVKLQPDSKNPSEAFCAAQDLFVNKIILFSPFSSCRVLDPTQS